MFPWNFTARHKIIIARVTKYMRWCDDIHHGCKVYHETRAESKMRPGLSIESWRSGGQ